MLWHYGITALGSTRTWPAATSGEPEIIELSRYAPRTPPGSAFAAHFASEIEVVKSWTLFIRVRICVLLLISHMLLAAGRRAAANRALASDSDDDEVVPPTSAPAAAPAPPAAPAAAVKSPARKAAENAPPKVTSSLCQ